jgi:RNA polymerase sigma-70 factor (ECF subfamily)
LSGRNSISTEIQLWNNLRAGDKSALGHLYKLHVKVLYNFGNKICHDIQLVEDSIHDLFVDLWKNRKNLSEAQSVRAYLYASLRRRIVKAASENVSMLRFDARWDELNLVTYSDEAKIVDQETSDEQLKKLKAHLNNLSPRQYEAIVLRYYDDLSYSEIAAIMEMNEQSVRNLIQRGLEHLRQYSRLVISLLLFANFLLA